MFASFRRGFGFLGQAANMAAKDHDLLKPAFFSMMIGAVVSLVGAIPMVLLALLMGSSDVGYVLMFILGAILMFIEFAISYVFSGMTVRLVYDYLTGGDGRMDLAWASAKKNLANILTLALASVGVKLVESLLRGGNRRGGQSMVGGMAAGILDGIWTSATYFILPAMILEELNLGQSLKRATQIIKNNLLLVAVSEVGVNSVIGLISFFLVLLAIGLGVGIVVLAGQLASWSTLSIILGVGAAILIAGTIIALVTAFSSYITTAYHTCLFLWARSVEEARSTGQINAVASAPAPLAAVLQ
jgi:hypothetical protein